MHDWMISKKRYWGLALPIYDCPKCGTFDVIGGRQELRERAVAGWDGDPWGSQTGPAVEVVGVEGGGAEGFEPGEQFAQPPCSFRRSSGGVAPLLGGSLSRLERAAWVVVGGQL